MSKLAETGHEIIFGYRKPGDFLGENILTDADMYPRSAWCRDESLLCGFSKERFDSLALKQTGKIVNLGKTLQAV